MAYGPDDENRDWDNEDDERIFDEADDFDVPRDQRDTVELREYLERLRVLDDDSDDRDGERRNAAA